MKTNRVKVLLVLSLGFAIGARLHRFWVAPESLADLWVRGFTAYALPVPDRCPAEVYAVAQCPTMDPYAESHTHAGDDRHVLIVGASVAAGWGASDETKAYWSFLPWSVTVIARPGARAAWEVEQIRRELGRWTPDGIIVLTGSNDMRATEMRMTPAGMQRVPEQERYQGWRAAIEESRRLAREAGVPICIVRQPDVFRGRWARAQAKHADLDLLTLALGPSLYDGVHLTDRGQQELADQLVNFLRQRA